MRPEQEEFTGSEPQRRVVLTLRVELPHNSGDRASVRDTLLSAMSSFDEWAHQTEFTQELL